MSEEIGDPEQLIGLIMEEKRYETVNSCTIEIPSSFCLTVFGASGDLAQRKIFPALYRLDRDRLFPGSFAILGTARTEMNDAGFRALMRDAVKDAFPESFDESSWQRFSKRLSYLKIDYEDIGDYRRLKEKIGALERKHRTLGNRILYLAVPPVVYEPVISRIGAVGLSRSQSGYTHIVIEKPIGRDLESARELNRVLQTSFSERQVYRMDHYLAKETVQNILMFRFANSIFEPLWNQRYIDHVQITVTETLGVEHRAGYYEHAGILRDMFQNHMFQLLALTAMEPPSIFESERVRDEKAKVFRSIRPFPLDRLDDAVVIGQYGEGMIQGGNVSRYRDEQGVSSESVTPTFAAMKVLIDNWRWNGVPFYLRSGKRLSRKKAEISVHFRPAPHLMFSRSLEEGIEPNVLAIRIQPDEGISLHIQVKTPGARICMSPVLMDFAYQKVFGLSDYERVLLDCMQGDQMLFVRGDGVEETWGLLSPLIERLESGSYPKDFPNYEAGSAGPAAADALLRKDGRSWRPL